MKAVILAAGLGSRLGRPQPKALTVLESGQTIMAHQIDSLGRYMSLDDVLVVVGFKKELIMEAFPSLVFVYNDEYDGTNTSKSLLRALRKTGSSDVLWLNGDVVFDHRVMQRVLDCGHSCMAVTRGAVGDEEVKFRTGESGLITQVSKRIQGAEGEAVGINLVSSTDAPPLLEALETCADGDYFERGIEIAIAKGARFRPVDVTDLVCLEIDFKEDLDRANRELETLVLSELAEGSLRRGQTQAHQMRT